MKSKPINAVIVDDEYLAAAYLEKLVSSFEFVEVAGVFYSPSKVVAGIEGLMVDIVFLDIEMPRMSGLELIESLKALDPNIEIVLVTGYGQYALEAYKKHALGYLLKPCTRQDVEYYLEQVRHLRRKRRKRALTVKAFGAFEVFADGESVSFSNAKAKELLAFLVDARGAEVSVETIASALWEGHAFDKSATALVRRAVSDLRRLGRSLGADDLVAGSRGHVSLNVEYLHCDFYDYLDGKDIEYTGSYMEQYTWAEETSAALAFGSLR